MFSVDIASLMYLTRLSCLLWSMDRVNDFPQVPHVYGLTPVCVLSCPTSTSEYGNDFPQISQT